MLERPSPGNHEYYAYTKKGDNEPAQNGVGYFGYFNGHDQNGIPNAQGQAGVSGFIPNSQQGSFDIHVTAMIGNSMSAADRSMSPARIPSPPP